MNFIEKIFEALSKMLSFVAGLFSNLIEFLLKPLSYLLYFLEGLVYFINVLFQVVLKVIMIFVALFQFVISLCKGIYRTVMSLFDANITSEYQNYPSTTWEGFSTVLEVVNGTGLMNVIPAVATVFVWLLFIVKIVGLFGGNISINPFR